MKALQFQYNLPRLAFDKIVGSVWPGVFFSALGPLAMVDLPEPQLPGDDWVLLRTALTGICGSDSKQIFLDADFDNPLTSLISFPHVLGHEVTGVIERVGPGVRQRQVGERVVLNPWLSCAPRGIQPPCPACQQGLYMFCRNFTAGALPAGMHIGNNRAVGGGFASHMVAHESQLFPIPDAVSVETAVLADPFSVSLHAVLKRPPAPGELAVVYGCGTLGILTVAILKVLFPQACVAAVARHPVQIQLVRDLGADRVIRAAQADEIITAVAEQTGEPVLAPQNSRPWLMGGADVVYDTVGTPATVETGLRLTRPRGAIVITGVGRPQRLEWTPLYFKEIEVIGSNAFGLETLEGERLHAIEIYLRLLASGRLRMPDLVTHRFPLAQYRQALLVANSKDRHKAVKVVFDFTAHAA